MEHPFQISPSSGLRWSGKTHSGRVRPNNEDAFIGLQFDAREMHYLGSLGQDSQAKMDYAFAVSDGMGGARAGEHASRMAVQKIAARLPLAYQQSAVGLETGFSDILDELFTEIHRSIVYLGDMQEDCRGMQATLSLCWFTPGRMYFGHIGDSRIYYLPARAGRLRQLTEDDTHVAWLLRNGKISTHEARNHPRRHILQRALGGGNQFVSPQVGAVTYEPGDLFLLCTDGLTGGLFDENMEEFLRIPESTAAESQPADALVNQSVVNDGRDNTTALVIKVI